MQNPTRGDLVDLLANPAPKARRRAGLELHRRQVIADMQENLDDPASDGDVDDVLAFVALEAAADLVDALEAIAVNRSIVIG